MKSVVHVMRTYGAHGGERQLHRMFSFPDPNWDEHFLYVYRDDKCERLFSDLGHLKRFTLVPVAVYPRQSPWLEFLILLLFLPFAQLRFLRYLSRTNCRICIVHGFQAALVAWPALWLMPSLKAAYVHRTTKPTRSIRWVFRLLYRPFLVIAGVSHAVADSLQRVVGSRQVRVLANGINWKAIAEVADQCRNHKKQDVLVLISVGRLLEHKHHEEIVRAFAKLRQWYYKTELWLVGDGDRRRDLMRLIEYLGVTGCVRLLGQRGDVPRLLGQGDIYVHASEVEGMSNAVLEAMAAGLPCVVVDAPGVTECLEPGVTGIVVSRSEDDLVAGLLMLAKNPCLRAKMGSKARERIKNHYSIEANRLRYCQLYEELSETR